MNRKLVLFAAIAFSTLPVSCAPATEANSPVKEHVDHERMGSHGMVMFGNNDISFYHLALYRRPHDRQILTPATFVNESDKTHFNTWRRNHDGIVTIVPNNFDLNRLDPNSTNPINQFDADIYQGHFERGGKLMSEKIAFALSSPVLFQAVQADGESSARYTYVTHGENAYFVKDIGPRPGEDRILFTRAVDRLVDGEPLVLLTAENSETSIFEQKDGTKIEVENMTTIYLETADFK